MCKSSAPVMLWRLLTRCCMGIAVVGLAIAPSQAAVDPTRPPSQPHNEGVSMGVTANAWQLQAIRISAQGRSAVINGVQVRQGESIRKAKVVAIEPGSVVLKQSGRQILLTLGPLLNIKRNSQESE